MSRTRSGGEIMPERVLGILDDPQRVLAIFLGKKAQNALWATSIHSLNAHNALWAHQHTNNTRITYEQTLQQHANKTPTYQ